MSKYKNAIGIIKACGLNIKGDKKLMEQAKQIENTIIEALEKQMPKKVDEYLTSSFCCPICTNVLSRYSIYCPNCGQALDWGDCE